LRILYIPFQNLQFTVQFLDFIFIDFKTSYFMPKYIDKRITKDRIWQPQDQKWNSWGLWKPFWIYVFFIHPPPPKKITFSRGGNHICFPFYFYRSFSSVFHIPILFPIFFLHFPIDYLPLLGVGWFNHQHYLTIYIPYLPVERSRQQRPSCSCPGP
jgi:hypothetical protein